MYEEYELLMMGGNKVSCNESHLFETTEGWISAKEMEQSNLIYKLITNEGIKIGRVYKTINKYLL
jgi:hypothetical protein